MPKVLLVEDDPAQLEIFATELSDHAPELTVLTALSAEHALRIINSEEVNVLVTDLRMPGMDGIELLAQVSRIDPDIASLALSGALTKEMTSDLTKIGVDHVLAKPLPPGMLAEEVRRAVKGATLGFVRGFSLPTLLQLIQLERKTCTLDVRSNGRAGFLYFREGELFDAEVDGKVGREAAETVVCWPSPAWRSIGIARRRNGGSPSGRMSCCSRPGPDGTRAAGTTPEPRKSRLARARRRSIP